MKVIRIESNGYSRTRGVLGTIGEIVGGIIAWILVLGIGYVCLAITR